MISYAGTEQHTARDTANRIEFRQNNRVQATAVNVRSCLVPASSSSSGLALDVKDAFT
jgi:hypothetical protein